ncbi:dodecin domain-containing protein [Subsaximicrobium wynnwilliamsii]|uniref:Dodecin domain-containing protein n=1 Tax=Subsaximicrobium wynnwilliamsii TaxID=291179 RepID=A0A5C6ZHY7_9FLAO|nr:dodecin family protein [Subsaximicrobium wynnwilliamsii]TXD84106.1 dodecin domain-containing protein [Subsaximicrobium wynnwilliamsii]TXD88936.1 dodecin domain-containing protein [Subsaximicrobium wynnwilliamsii]TXE03818.1 dodecin domain-containing protein [Subsaximicrobium wynnwilliamsii]
MAVLKVIEIMANSEKSWEDATKKAVLHAGKTVKNIKSAYVREQSVAIKDNAVSEFRVNVKITFEVS